MRRTEAGIHAMGVDGHGLVASTCRLLRLGLEDAEGPGIVPPPDGIDEDEDVVAVEELIGEMDAADAELPHLHTLGHGQARQTACHLHSETVVAEEDVPDAGHEHPRRHGASPPASSISSGRK